MIAASPLFAGENTCISKTISRKILAKHHPRAAKSGHPPAAKSGILNQTPEKATNKILCRISPLLYNKDNVRHTILCRLFDNTSQTKHKYSVNPS
jgi:hypothetical protein